MRTENSTQHDPDLPAEAGESQPASMKLFDTTVSLFEGVKKTRCTEDTLSRERFIDPPTATVKEAGELFAPALYPEQTRHNDTQPDKLTLLWFDIDAPPGDTGAERSGAVRELCRSINEDHGIEFVCHTTWRHTVELPRYRLLLPLTRPVTLGEYRAVWRSVQSAFGIPSDPSANSPKQLVYLPVQRLDADGEPFSAYKQRMGEGAAIDPELHLDGAELVENEPMGDDEAEFAEACAQLHDHAPIPCPAGVDPVTWVNAVLSQIDPCSLTDYNADWFPLILAVAHQLAGDPAGEDALIEWAIDEGRNPYFNGGTISGETYTLARSSADLRKTYRSEGKGRGRPVRLSKFLNATSKCGTTTVLAGAYAQCIEQTTDAEQLGQLADHIVGDTFCQGANAVTCVVNAYRRSIERVDPASASDLLTPEQFERRIADRNRYQQQQAEDIADERLTHYLERAEQGGTLADIRAIMRDVRDDDALTHENRLALRKPVQAMYERAGLKAPPAKELDAKLSPEPLVLGGQIGRPNVVDTVLADFDARASYYCDEGGNPCIERCDDQGRPVTLRPLGSTLSDWLLSEGPATYGRRLSKNDRQEVIDNLAAKARRSGQVRKTRMRYAVETNERGAPVQVFEYVGDADRTVIEYSAAGVRIASLPSDSTYRFTLARSAVAMAPHVDVDPAELPERLARLIAQMNIPAGMEPALVALLVMARVSPDVCPVLVATGGHQSGKSALIEQYQDLTDRQPSEQKAPSKDQRGLRSRLNGNHMTAEHNAERYSPAMQNDLCVAADGGSVEEAKLYSNGESVGFRLAGPVAISSTNPAVLSQADVLSRSLQLRITPPAVQIEPTELRALFQADLPYHHATIRALCAEVIRRWDEVQDTTGHRYGWFARIGNIVAPIMGDPRSFSEIMNSTKERERVEAFEGSVFAQDIASLIGIFYPLQVWTGTSVQLLAELERHLGRDRWDRRQSVDGYPRSARDVLGHLDELADVLAVVGVDFARTEKRTKRGQCFTLAQNENAPKGYETAGSFGWMLRDIADEFDVIPDGVTG